MANFQTPLPVHRAAFARVSKTLDMPDEGLEELRKAFQAAERSGDPQRCWRDVSDALAQHIWAWPALEDAALSFGELRLRPILWTQEKLPDPYDWHQVTHAARTRLVLATLHSAVTTEKALADFHTNRKDRAIPGKLSLKTGNARCAASIDAEARFRQQIAAGDLSMLPPFFPGDATYLRMELQIPRRR